MQTNYMQTLKFSAILLLILACTQVTYTALYLAELSVPRQFLWGLEGLLFTVLAAFAGAAMIQTKDEQLAWSAITVSAILNVVQVSIGVTLFVPFRQAASEIEALGVAAGGIVALSFMIYYAAKLLLGLAALAFGMKKFGEGGKLLGGVTALSGVVAIVSNGVLVMFGRDVLLPSAVAGASGVIATLLLSICLLTMAKRSK